MTLVVLDLGTNIDREKSLATALEHLAQALEIRSASSVYKTVPVGMSSQPDFFNLALEVETDKTLEEIRNLSIEIEDKMGRNRSAPKFGPRNIDIDVVLYGDEVDESKGLPHPQALKELFVVGPMAELRPEGQHPGSKESWIDLRRKLMGGRSDKDAGIEKLYSVSDLPLGDELKSLLASKAKA